MECEETKDYANNNSIHQIEVQNNFDQDSNSCIIQSLFSNLSTIEKSLLKFNNYHAHPLVLSNEDLVKVLKGTVYSVEIEKLIDSKKIINSIETYFNSLICSQENCGRTAIMAYLDNEESSNCLYCQKDITLLGHETQQPHFFEKEKILNIKAIIELEKLLIEVQNEIAYLKSENTPKNTGLYESNKKELEAKFNDLKKNCEQMESRIIDFIQNSLRKSYLNIDSYKSISFVKEECEKLKHSIFKIQSMIRNILQNSHTDYMIQVLAKLNNVEQYEENKGDYLLAVPEEIYAKKYELVYIRVQSMILIQEFCKNIKDNLSNFNNCKKNLEELIESVNSVKEDIKFKLNKLDSIILKQSKETLKKLSLREIKFYKDHIDDFNEENFLKCREVFESLGQFEFDREELADRVHKQIGSSGDGNLWVYFGQLKSDTNVKQGIGILVRKRGDIYEGHFKNNEKNGFGRYIYTNGDYYIGEYKNDKRHGQGTLFCFDGTRISGLWKEDKLIG